MSLRFKRVCGKAGHHIKALYILSMCLGLVIENPLWPRTAKAEFRFLRRQITHGTGKTERPVRSYKQLDLRGRAAPGPVLPAAPRPLLSWGSEWVHVPTSSPPTCSMYQASTCRHLLQNTTSCFVTTHTFLDVRWTNKDAGSSFYTEKLQLEGDNLWAVPHCIYFLLNQLLMVTAVLPLDSPISCSLWSTMTPHTRRHIMNRHTTNS